MSVDGVSLERANSKGLPQPLAGICLALVALGITAFIAGLMRDPDKIDENSNDIPSLR